MNYGTATRFSPARVLELAEQFFGHSGLGLHVEARRSDGVDLVGPRGRVTVKVQMTNGTTEVFLTTQALDEQVRQFMVEIYEEAQHA